MVSSEELLGRLEMFGTRLGLESPRRLLAALGDPQNRLNVVLVGGTNGKGSTAALLSSIATAAGYRAGLYSSPHLERVHERVRVEGRSISEARLAECLGQVLNAAEGALEGPLTYFEALTAATLVHFAREAVELAVLEVGLGGRLDATNATEPKLSLITEIGLDHRQHLGETLAEIAVEKAGILRPERPALAWVEGSEVRGALEGVAAEVGARLRWVNDECQVGELSTPEPAAAPVSSGMKLTTGTSVYRATLALPGRHQRANAALAVAAAEELAAAGWTRFDHRSIEAGLTACRWPGRLEWVCPAASGDLFLLDGAHNPAAIATLIDYLSDLGVTYTLVFGALREKQVEHMLPPLAAGAERILLTAPRSPRAIDPGELAELVADRSPEVVSSTADALAAALGSGSPIVVTGSLYLVGEMRTELRRRFGVPRPAAEMTTCS